MRVSIEKGDPGYRCVSGVRVGGSRVYLNGIRLERVRTADEEQKLVVLDVPDGCGGYVTETWYGSVRIALSGALRAALRSERRS